MKQSDTKYLIGDIQIEGIEPTEGFKVYADLEQKGLAASEDYKIYLDKKYKIKNVNQEKDYSNDKHL